MKAIYAAFYSFFWLLNYSSNGAIKKKVKSGELIEASELEHAITFLEFRDI